MPYGWKLIRCTCGRALGKVDGKYEFLCRCGAVVKGATDPPKKISHGPPGKK